MKIMWVDEETYDNMMLGTLIGTIIGLMLAAIIWIFRLAFGANRWFYNFLKDKGMNGWQSFLVCTGTTVCAFVFFCSPLILSGVNTYAHSKSNHSQLIKQEKPAGKNTGQKTLPSQKQRKGENK